jgi:hypothetical protein
LRGAKGGAIGIAEEATEPYITKRVEKNTISGLSPGAINLRNDGIVVGQHSPNQHDE